jgi:hypothetical protein
MTTAADTLVARWIRELDESPRRAWLDEHDLVEDPIS